jgi:hypothetical protein
MSRLRGAAVRCAAAIMALTGVASAAAAPAAAAPAAAAPAAGARHGDSVAARVYGRTYVLLGPGVFGVTVQQDPLTYHVVKLTDGTVHGRWRYDYWESGQQTTFSGPVTCMSVSGNRAWIGGPVTASSDPAQVGMGAWWQVADNGTGRHPVVPDQTTFVGFGTMAQTVAYCDGEPAPHFIFDVQLGGVRVQGLTGGS